jgi:hypothetical protein
VRSVLRACGHRVHGARFLRGHADTFTKGAECSHAAKNVMYYRACGAPIYRGGFSVLEGLQLRMCGTRHSGPEVARARSSAGVSPAVAGASRSRQPRSPPADCGLKQSRQSEDEGARAGCPRHSGRDARATPVRPGTHYFLNACS